MLHYEYEKIQRHFVDRVLVCDRGRSVLDEQQSGCGASVAESSCGP